MSAEQLVINHKPYLAAVGNGTLLTVSRSLAMSVDDPRYLPVTQYIRDYGLVLYSREVGPERDMYGRSEQSWYATPEARNLLMEN